MKKMALLIVLCIGLMAQSQENPTYENQNSVGVTAIQGQETTVQGQGFATAGSDASASAKSGDSGAVSILDFHPSSTSIYPENHAQPINPGHPSPPWLMPSEGQICLWNAAASDMLAYERTWTMDEVNFILKGIVESRFTCSSAFLEKISPTSRIEVRLVQTPIGKTAEGILYVGISHSDVSKKNSWKGDVNVRGSKDKTFMVVLAKALKQAMLKGGEFAIINSGMDVSYNGMTISPGIGLGTAGIQNSFSLIGSIASTEARAKGSPVVKLGVYRHNGVASISSPTIGSGTEEGDKKKSNKMGEIKGIPVNPEVVSMVIKY
jgi:hypothetical protein